MTSLKIIRVNDGLGVALPAETLAELGVREGDSLTMSAVSGGVQLSRAAQVSDPVAAQLEAGRAFARDYAETLKALAK
jgi:hypothetical protein